jgi:hypothetical protein
MDEPPNDDPQPTSMEEAVDAAKAALKRLYGAEEYVRVEEVRRAEAGFGWRITLSFLVKPDPKPMTVHQKAMTNAGWNRLVGGGDRVMRVFHISGYDAEFEEMTIRE